MLKRLILSGELETLAKNVKAYAMQGLRLQKYFQHFIPSNHYVTSSSNSYRNLSEVNAKIAAINVAKFCEKTAILIYKDANSLCFDIVKKAFKF